MAIIKNNSVKIIAIIGFIVLAGIFYWNTNYREATELSNNSEYVDCILSQFDPEEASEPILALLVYEYVVNNTLYENKSDFVNKFESLANVSWNKIDNVGSRYEDEGVTFYVLKVTHNNNFDLIAWNYNEEGISFFREFLRPCFTPEQQMNSKSSQEQPK